jgi:isocitrate/isopropylmalate dehydrogenase
LIEGDGIGPEIAQSVKDIFAAAKVRPILYIQGLKSGREKQ